MAKNITAADLYLTFRSLEKTYGHFCDVVAGAINTVIPPGQEFPVDDDTYNGIVAILNPPIAGPNPCDRPPYCLLAANRFAQIVGDWTNKAGAAARATEAVAEVVGGAEIEFVTRSLPGSPFPGHPHHE
jgi:hypothetical protein